MNGSTHRITVPENILLAPWTTIGLGGPARYFLTATTPEMIQDGLRFSSGKKLPVQVLGGGSNIIFPDNGFRGLVLHIGLKGLTMEDDGDSVVVTAAAGEPFDEVILSCIEHGLSGLECLSGIPGSTGAVPVQNVGAYGQEISETLISLRALHRPSLSLVDIPAGECSFAYRQSRFKSAEKDKYVIISVVFRLKKNGRPVLRYQELQKMIDESGGLQRFENGSPALQAVRLAVLALRRTKSMVVDPEDPDSRSVGSFFTNPILNQESFQTLIERWKKIGDGNPIPSFVSSGGMKVPAAWLIEKSGFHRGYRHKGVGISANHSLALVNYGGTTKALLDLASTIEAKVHEKFSIHLEREPVLVP